MQNGPPALGSVSRTINEIIEEALIFLIQLSMCKHDQQPNKTVSKCRN